MNKEVQFYERNADNSILCQVCPKHCTIKPGQKGFCRVKINLDGVLYATNYGMCTSYGLDPIEKKPLYHFYPGSYILSLGTVGCNLRCGFCQNWEIAQGDPGAVYLSPEKAVDTALASQEQTRCIGLAYTYSEPLMWFEYVYDTALLAQKQGLKNVLVTNGYINEKPLRKLLPYIDAMNIDVKGFTDNYYKKTCAGGLEPVMRTVEIAAQYCQVEVTTLLVTGMNDSPSEIRQLSQWLSNINREIPLHLSRYFPNYKFDLEPTPLETIQKAKEIAEEYLDFVYVGNAPNLDGGKTFCPDCNELLIDRRGYRTNVVGIAENLLCRNCGRKINIKL